VSALAEQRLAELRKRESELRDEIAWHRAVLGDARVDEILEERDADDS
jgi:hypothetical protein